MGETVCPPGWRITSLGQLVRLQRGYDLPGRVREAGNVPVIGSGGRTGWHNETRAKAPGVVLGRATNLGRPFFVREDYWPLNTTLYVTDFLGNDPHFIYYLFKTMDLSGYNSGSVQPMLNRNYIDGIPVCVPTTVAEQEAIAAVLGALDDKIRANTPVVSRLSDLAKALLQNAADSEQTFVVGDVADVRKGISYTSAGLSDDGMPMVNLANAANFGWLKRSGFKHYAGAYKPRHVAQPGSLLVAGVEQTWRNEIIGWPMLLPDDVGPALFSQDVFLIDFAPEHAWLRLPLWAHLFTADARARLESMVYGTTVARFPADALTGLAFPAPTDSDRVLDIAQDLLRRAWAAEVESAKLAAVRDALLPPLMSGEMRVGDAEAALAEVT